MDRTFTSLRPSWTTTRWGRLCALTVVAFGTLMLRAAPAAAQLSVEDLELRFVQAAATGSPRAPLAAKSFRINNTGDAPIQATITLADWDRSETGQNRYFPAGSQPESCAASLSVFPMVIRLEPHSTEDVRVAIKDSSAVGIACHSILFVETPPPPANTRGAALSYRLRYGVKVYVETDAPFAGDIVSSALVSAPVTGAPGSGATRADSMEIVYRNPGTRQSLTSGEIEVRRPDNTVAARIPIAEFPVLPGATRRLRVALPVLAAGRYVVLAMLEFGGEEVLAAQVEWDVP
ncbi:MAG: hypothetical protein NTW72_13270 [Gemmatimonadetes bacterium]|nr:hypothetical protein [Gemmatimonadota bacterium]